MLKLKKGDNVKVISGKDRGKSGKIIQAFPEDRKVVVEGVNMFKKHIRVRKEGEKGQVLEFAAPLAVENVMLVCPKCAKPARVGMKLLDSGDGPSTGLRADKARKVRICRNCKEVIE